METYFDVETFVNELKTFPKTNKELIDLIYDDIVRKMIDDHVKEKNELLSVIDYVQYKANIIFEMQQKKILYHLL